MIRPFERVVPGEPISASEYNRAMEEIERQQRFDVGGSLRLSSDASGTRLDMDSHPHIWVRITGHETGNYSGVFDATKYSGIEQTDDPSTDGTYDLDGGMKFYTDGLYLKEVNGRTDVPENAIVHAYQSDNGPYYTFLFEQAFEGDSSGGNVQSSCPVWSCQADFGSGVFSFGHCPSEFWTFDGVNPTPHAPYDWCGCVNSKESICWPAYGTTDLQSTGISTGCLLACESDQIVPRRACLHIVPGGPFGLRLALLSVDDGHELHTPEY